MDKSQQAPAKCHSEAYLYEWYLDIQKRLWVVVGFWYEEDGVDEKTNEKQYRKDKVHLLQYGKTSYVTVPYSNMQIEIQEKRMLLVTEQKSQE